MRYWDSSALVALHVQQQATREVRALYASDSEVVTWILSDIELASALERLGRDGAMNDREVAEAISRLESFWPTVHFVSLIDAVKLRAKRLLRTHALKAADSLQLGAALAVVHDDPYGWDFVCLDQRLAGAARREGFSVAP